MPELPEVETLRLGLAKELTGLRMEKVTVRQPKLRLPVPTNLPKILTGSHIKSLRRRAKYLLINLEKQGKEPLTLVVHLGMSGSLGLAAASPRQQHDHVIFTLENDRELRFNDPRRFGMIFCIPTNCLPQNPLFAHLGPEPLEEDFSSTYLHTALKKRAAPVKNALMNNRLVVGIGNIYANESLFAAGLSPLRLANQVTREESGRLHAAIRQTLEAALAAGGSSIRDFRHGDGKMGYFQHEFKVYNKAGTPCPRCGAALEKTSQGGRSSFYCGTCQK